MSALPSKEPSCPRCGSKFIQVLDFIRGPRPEAKYVGHGCDKVYTAYVPGDWNPPPGWLPAFM